jgi:hypothetical protein
VCLLPLLFAFAAWFPDGAPWSSIPFAGVLYVVLAGLLAQLARDRGSRLEPDLARQWGGMPTTQLLRHRSSSVNPVLRQHYHVSLRAVLRDVRLPSAEEEAAEPHGADHIYEACVARLRECTRDRATFPLVFEENANYGYRRNLVALRPVGIAIAIVSLVAAGVRAATIFHSGSQFPVAAMVAVFGDLVLLALWRFHFDSDWVRIAADAYARQLLAACERLPTGPHVVSG